jgi:NAD(P)H-hydrate epimerase
MLKSLTRTQVREIDRRCAEEFGISGLLLMENAGRSCVEAILNRGSAGASPARVVICCGKGNNGGDGFVIARLLDALGVPIKIVLFANPAELRGDAAVNCQIALKSRLPMAVVGPNVSAVEIDKQLVDADWIIDALLGTGATGDPKPPLSLAIERINAAPAKRFSVDLPSGLDCDTGEPGNPTVRADVTCTFVASKNGFSNPRAQEFLGVVEIGTIGAPRVLLEEYLGARDHDAQ